MSTVVAKIQCPNPAHKDDTPSCAVYDDASGFCFGCNSYFKNLSTEGTQPYTTGTHPKEDMVVSINYIETLPLVEHRGLLFPYDSTGYYLVWPCKTYYKKRRWPSPEGPKYIGPKGHQAPWFELPNNSPNNTHLCMVEGEINALSMDAASPGMVIHSGCNIISPGGTSGFMDTKLKKTCVKLSKYSKITLILDADKGLEPARKCKDILVEIVPDIRIILMEEDWNAFLIKYGKEKTAEKLKAYDL